MDKFLQPAIHLHSNVMTSLPCDVSYWRKFSILFIFILLQVLKNLQYYLNEEEVRMQISDQQCKF